MTDLDYGFLIHDFLKTLILSLESNASVRELTTTIFLADVPEGTVRPYIVIVPENEDPNAKTNKSRFVDIDFKIAAVANKFIDTIGILSACRNVMNKLRLPEIKEWANVEIQKIDIGITAYEKIIDFWASDTSYKVQLSQARSTVNHGQ